MVSIQKFWIIVLVSNRIEYWSNYSIRNFEYSHSTNFLMFLNFFFKFFMAACEEFMYLFSSHAWSSAFQCFKLLVWNETHPAHKIPAV